MKNEYMHLDFHCPQRGVHGYVPENFMASLMGKSARWSVPLAVLIGVPLCSKRQRVPSPLPGGTVQNLTPQIARELGLKKIAGVVVTGVEPGSPAAEAMIQIGDVIQAVNRKPAKDVDDFVKIIEKAKGGGSLLLLVQRGQNTLFAAATPK
jgi:S1-C subfamily serine protease